MSSFFFFLHLKTSLLSAKLIIIFFISQCNEVGASPRMEREGLLRSLQILESAGLRVGAIVTDRHPSIQKYLREQRPEIQHYFDTWHVSKGNCLAAFQINQIYIHNSNIISQLVTQVTKAQMKLN